MTLKQQLHKSATHKAGIDPACPVCSGMRYIRISMEHAKLMISTGEATVAAKSSPIFGTHIREGIEIIKDWIEHP